MNRTPETVPVPTKGRPFVRVDSAMLERYGSNVAIFFAKISNLMNMRASKSVYFSNKKMEKETGMKEKQQRGVRRVLKDERLLKEKRMGRGAMIHYFFDKECEERYNALLFSDTPKQFKTLPEGGSKQFKTSPEGGSYIRENILKRENILNKGDFEKSKSRASLFPEKSQEDFSPSGGEPRKEPALEGKNKKAGDSDGNFFPSKVDSQGEKSQGKKALEEKKRQAAAAEKFTALWKMYGARGDKKKARKKYLSLSESLQDFILTQVPWYLEYLKLAGYAQLHLTTYLNQERYNNNHKEEWIKLGGKMSEINFSVSNAQRKGNAGEVLPSAEQCIKAFHKGYQKTYWTEVYSSYNSKGEVDKLWKTIQDDYPEEAKQVYCIIAFGNKYKADWKKDLYNPIYHRGELNKLWKMIQKDYPKKAKAILLDLFSF